MQPQRTAFLLLVSLALLGLGLLATLGVAGLFSEDLKEATSTAGIEVVLADRNGYRHFLVFDRVRSVENLSADYSVELWVDNFVALDPQPVSRLVFFSGKDDWESPFIRGETVSQANAHPTTVLHFDVTESALRALAAAKVDRLHLELRSGDFLEFTPVDSQKIHQAVQQILDGQPGLTAP